MGYFTHMPNDKTALYIGLVICLVGAIYSGANLIWLIKGDRIVYHIKRFRAWLKSRL